MNQESNDKKGKGGLISVEEEKKKKRTAPANAQKFTKENAKEFGRRGGLKSGEVRKEKKQMKEMLELMMEMPLKKGKVQEFTNLEDADGKNITIQTSILLAAIKQAQAGDTKALAFIRDTLGQKPKDQVEVEATGSVEISILKEIAEQLKEDTGDEIEDVEK